MKVVDFVKGGINEIKAVEEHSFFRQAGNHLRTAVLGAMGYCPFKPVKQVEEPKVPRAQQVKTAVKRLPLNMAKAVQYDLIFARYTVDTLKSVAIAARDNARQRRQQSAKPQTLDC